MKNSGIPSPCIGLCEIDPEERICRGCLRTRVEIVAWRQASDTEKAAIMERLTMRHRERNSRQDQPE